jgi:2-deoxy-D-gluconate 3-dehydrogenase
MTAPSTPITDLIRLSGKTAIVTGGAMGIGYGICYRLAEAGANVVVADQNENEANVAAKRLADLGFSATAVRVDVAAEPDVERMVAGAVDTYGAVDILVNNAGIYPNILVMNMTAADFMHVVNVNLTGVFLCTKHVAQHMIQRGGGGRIINVTSIDALHPSSAGLAHYDASKHGPGASPRTSRWNWRHTASGSMRSPPVGSPLLASRPRKAVRRCRRASTWTTWCRHSPLGSP